MPTTVGYDPTIFTSESLRDHYGRGFLAAPIEGIEDVDIDFGVDGHTPDSTDTIAVTRTIGIEDEVRSAIITEPAQVTAACPHFDWLGVRRVQNMVMDGLSQDLGTDLSQRVTIWPLDDPDTCTELAVTLYVPVTWKGSGKDLVACVAQPFSRALDAVLTGSSFCRPGALA